MRCHLERLEKVRSLDLNLLTAFAFLEQTRSVTVAAKMLGLSQPAMSHVLSRLRLALGDRLFVKTPKEMVPTPRALALAPFIHSMLAQIERAIFDVEVLSPQTLVRTFRIKTTDFIEAVIVPQLLSLLEQEAPAVKISVTSPEFRFPREALELGLCDVAIGGFFDVLPDGFYQQTLFEDDFSCAVRKRHPRLGRRKELTIQQFCEEQHLLIAPGGELKSKLDDVLAQRKKSRCTVAGCGSYLVSGWILDQTDSVLTAPTRLINLLADKFEFAIFPLPFKFPKISIVQVWHERNHQDLAHQWFRRQIRETAVTSMYSTSL
jgi:DNA-binding transcriptional LysR family regulator